MPYRPDRPGLAFHAVLCALLGLGGAAPARADELAALINAYRTAPAVCAGIPSPSLPPLAPASALARLKVGPGSFLESALGRLGYEADRAQALTVTGPPDAAGAMEALREKYCGSLRSSEFSAIGTAHAGNEWQVVMAHQLVYPPLPDWEQAGRELVGLVNAARARPRLCGRQEYGAAGPLAWNPALAQAALAHSTDMATRHYFDHKSPNGSTPADRATHAGYRWVRIGENIASGQRTPQEAMASWLESPGHCANIMNPGFTEMGAAYAVQPGSRNRTPYWTQEFGAGR